MVRCLSSAALVLLVLAAGVGGVMAGAAVAAPADDAVEGDASSLPDPQPGPPSPSPLIDVVREPLVPRAGGDGAAAAGAMRNAALPDPPLQPPPPVVLDLPSSAGAAGARAPGGTEAALPDPLAGVEIRPGGGYRLRVTGGAPEGVGSVATLDPATARAAETIGRRLAAQAAPVGRVTVVAQVAAAPQDGTDVSALRRLSLARALAVKQALMAGGLDPTRIDLRPLGRTEEAVDAVDVLPPGAQDEAAAGAAQGGTVTR